MNEQEAPNDGDLDPESVDLPDRPEGSFEDAITASSQLEGESIDERVRREQPDRPERDRDRPNAPGGTDEASDGYVEGEST